MKLTFEMKQIELRAMSQTSLREAEYAVVDDDDAELGGLPAPRGKEARGPKMSPFD